MYVFQIKSRLENAYGADGSTRVKDAQNKANDERLLKNEARRKTRAVEDQLEVSQALAEDRLGKMGALGERVEELKGDIEEYKDMGKEYEEMKTLLESIPDFRPARGKGAGRGAASYPLHFRRLVWAQLSRGVAPSVIADNIVQVIKATAPWANVQAPTTDFMRKARTEATILGELCEAWRLADLVAVLSFGWDESTKYQTGMMSTNFQVKAGEKSGVAAGSVIDVLGRGCFVIEGGTAEQVKPSLLTELISRAH